MLKLANRSRDNYNFLAAPRRHHHFFVENFSLSAINITSIHVIGWVLPLCRETWSQMRWSNFEKVYFLRLTANYMLWRLSGLTFFARTGSFFWKRMHWLNQPKNCFNEVPHCPSSRKTHPAGQTLLGDNDSSRNGIMLLHKITLWRQRVSKLAASLPEYFAHAFSTTPSPQHSKMRKRSFPWTSCYCILFVHRRGIIIIIIIIFLLK